MLTATTAALVTRDNIWPGIKRSSVLRLSVDSLMWILFKCVVKSDEFKTAVHWSGCYQTPLTPEMKLNELKAALTSCHVMVSQQQPGWHVSWSLEATQVFLIRCCWLLLLLLLWPRQNLFVPCRGIITSSTWTPHTATATVAKTWNLQSSFNITECCDYQSFKLHQCQPSPSVYLASTCRSVSQTNVSLGKFCLKLCQVTVSTCW